MTDPTRTDAYIDAWMEEQHLEDAGLLDPGQPTRAAHMREIRRRWMRGQPFTARERRWIRDALGLPVDQEHLR